MRIKHANSFSALALGLFFGISHSSFVIAQNSPGEELKTFKVEPPLRVELVAAEPQVESPCAMAFDDQGRLFVAENRGYPHTTEPPQGRVVMLESTNHD